MGAKSICDEITRHFSNLSIHGEQIDRKGKATILPTHIQTQIGWHPLAPSFWKLNVDVAWKANTNSCGLGAS